MIIVSCWVSKTRWARLYFYCIPCEKTVNCPFHGLTKLEKIGRLSRKIRRWVQAPYIGVDGWTWAPFWRPISLIKHYEKFNWSATKTSTTTVQWKDQTALVGRPIKLVTLIYFFYFILFFFYSCNSHHT